MGLTLDPITYGRLLAAELPKPIEDEAEFDRATARLESLDLPVRKLTPEEAALRAILATLIAAYEARVDLPEAAPNEMIQFLMDQRGLKQADLVPVLGTRAQVSDAVTGRRGISKNQAKRLAEFFHVDADLFI